MFKHAAKLAAVSTLALAGLALLPAASATASVSAAPTPISIDPLVSCTWKVVTKVGGQAIKFSANCKPSYQMSGIVEYYAFGLCTNAGTTQGDRKLTTWPAYGGSTYVQCASGFTRLSVFARIM